MPKKSTDKKKINKKKQPAPRLLRGMKDILPEDQPWWNIVRDKVRSFADDYGFRRIDTPLLEQTSLFTRAVGEDTDIVQKEMYSFVDQGGDHITARPEASASVVRSYIEHGMLSLPQPVKLYYIGPMFRHERPQFGRYRQFHQFGFESLGEAHPVLDAESILLGHRLCQSLQLDVQVQVNSIGDKVCRPAYLQLLKSYFSDYKKSLCEVCLKRMVKNPLRVLDCKNASCRAVAENAPQTVDHLCKPCKDHFVEVLEHLDELQIAYNLNPRLVRGLDYYTRTVFEYWYNDERFGSNISLGGGGRYDDLAVQLGGRHTPVVGFACGIERLAVLLKERNTYPIMHYQPDVFIAQLGDHARKKALSLFDDLRLAGVKVRQEFVRDGLSGQLGIANKLGAQFVLILGQKEILDQTVLIRDMESGSQEIVPYDKIVKDIQRRLQKVMKSKK